MTSGGNGSDPTTLSTSEGPHFMPDLQSQYESLSDKLARESAEENASSTPPASSVVGGLGSDDKSKNKTSRKVRWAETATIASDINNATLESSDNQDYVPREPMDVLSDLFQRRYTLPIFLLVTTSIFLLVHFVGKPNVDRSIPRHDVSINASDAKGDFVLSARSGQLNIGGEDGYGDFGKRI